MRKIGLFGGTFNPIHLGHLRAAVEVRQGFGMDAIYLIPSASPPHKTTENLAPAQDRLAMVHRAIKGHAGLRVSDIEVKRSGPSYTVDTVCAFRRNLPSGVWLYLIMGIDAFQDIATWKDYKDLLHLAPVIVIDRPGVEPLLSEGRRAIESMLASSELEGYECSADTGCYVHCEKQPIFVFNVTALDISATRIRGLVRNGEPIDFLVTDSVKDYIVGKGLYA
ncbi:MAG: nicotinate-nucleotide adenylyltransferase [Desulfobacterales bacterium]